MGNSKFHFIDFEFIEDGKTIDPISVGIVDLQGNSFYRINKECDFLAASDWVIENVLTPMGIYVDKFNTLMPIRFHPHVMCYWDSKENIKNEILEFCGNNPKFVGYYADYDWVTMAQLFGKMIDLPEGYPMYCLDLKQWLDDLGNPEVPKNFDDKHHNALYDAQWNRQVYLWLRKEIRQGRLPSHPAFN